MTAIAGLWLNICVARWRAISFIFDPVAIREKAAITLLYD